jgi:DNA-binding MarR family transcriptional regulator
MLQDDRRMLGELLLAVAERMRVVFTRAAAGEGLTFMEGRALRLVVLHGRQSALGEVLGVAPSRISAMVRTLERRGFVVRRRSTGDRRHRDLVVTADGTAALMRIIGRLDEQSPLMTSLSDCERTTLQRLLATMLGDSSPAS